MAAVSLPCKWNDEEKEKIEETKAKRNGKK